MLTALTIARLLLVPVLIATFMVDPAVTAAGLLVFMVADLYDGVLARKLGADGPLRRALDTSIDRLAIDSCLVAAAFAGAIPAILVCGFLARDLYCAVICAQMMRERRVAIKSDLLYRGLSFLFAVWALSAPFLSASSRTLFALAIFVAAVGLAMDLTRSVSIVRNAPSSVANRVFDAGSLRSHALGSDAIPSGASPQGRERAFVTSAFVA